MTSLGLPIPRWLPILRTACTTRHGSLCFVFTLAPSGRAFVVWSTAIPLGGLVAFCLSMAVVDVLGFKFLGLGRGYNELGFAPLSVFCACVFVGVMLFVSRSGTPLSRSEETPAPQEAPG